MMLGMFGLLTALLAGCHHHGYRDADYPAHLLEHIDEHVEELALSDIQNDQYLEIRSRLEADLIKQQEQHKAFKSSLLAVIDNQASQVTDITALARSKVDEVPAMAKTYLDYIDEFHAVLDEQQRAQLMEEIREKAD